MCSIIGVGVRFAGNHCGLMFAGLHSQFGGLFYSIYKKWIYAELWPVLQSKSIVRERLHESCRSVMEGGGVGLEEEGRWGGEVWWGGRERGRIRMNQEGLCRRKEFRYSIQNCVQYQYPCTTKGSIVDTGSFSKRSRKFIFVCHTHTVSRYNDPLGLLFRSMHVGVLPVSYFSLVEKNSYVLPV